MSRAEDAIGHIALWRGKDVNVSSLTGGLTNENYLVEAGGERYVMRLPGTSTELLSIGREHEVYNARAAASAGIGPAVLEHLPQLDVMVLEFIEGPTMSAPALQSERMARRMAGSFKRLHAEIGPAVLEHLPQLDVMVLEFIEGPTMSAPALQSERMARRMAESFKRLHA